MLLSTENTDWLHIGSLFTGHIVGWVEGYVIPSCVVAAVRRKFPEADGVYTGFKLAEL